MRSLVPGMLLALVVLVCPLTSWAQPSQVAEVGVRTLMKDPGSFPKTIRVSGVVSQVVADSSLFGLIDAKEFKTCRKVTCADLVLPVRWQGTLPEVGATLTVTGKIQKDGDRYLFVARNLKAGPKP